MNANLLQMLSVTADSATSNDTMTNKLTVLVPVFPGQANWTHCFNYIMNFVARSMLKLFEVPKKSKEDVVLAAEATLQARVEDIEIKDLQTQVQSFADLASEGVDDDDDLFDEIVVMTGDEAVEFWEQVLPICMALVKVRRCVSIPSSCC